MQRLNGSVGLGGKNRKSDVISVQRALLAASVSPGPIDGICGRRTIQAIERFQGGVMRRPDGRIDVNGPSWRRLNQHVAASTHTPPPAAQSAAAPPPSSGPAPVTRSVPVPAQRSAAVARARTPAPVIAASAATPAAPPPTQRASGYWTTKTALPAAGTVNVGLSSPSSSDQVARFGGMPSAHMSQNDQPVTNPELKSLIATESVGPFRVTGIRPAIASLRSILDEVRRDLPDLLALLSSAGMEVNRLQRGSTTKVSNHAWGSAIDLRVGGVLVPLGASYSLKGLDALVPYFNRAGWYWGGGYRSRGRADPMHFELGGAMMAGVSR
ncbi:M15 family metallopeptidase [Sphingomonas alpina]|uniref:M15 family metallopeptidase n=1 Tax=Sphingomonas alpina TaxID=653931 RepID=A0A7H0LIP7_9SPHN|nr:M15 family metallopeptidase [Sphingomonas alpina]QNQ09550.1 M15 family metallopeptidase [Sphingomonas alpina]